MSIIIEGNSYTIGDTICRKEGVLMTWHVVNRMKQTKGGRIERYKYLMAPSCRSE